MTHLNEYKSNRGIRDLEPEPVVEAKTGNTQANSIRRKAEQLQSEIDRLQQIFLRLAKEGDKQADWLQVRASRASESVDGVIGYMNEIIRVTESRTSERIMWKQQPMNAGWKTMVNGTWYWLSLSPLGEWTVKEQGFYGKTIIRAGSKDAAKRQFSRLMKQNVTE